jgi:hypothetical protein
MEKIQSSIDWLEQEFVKLEATVGVHSVMYELIDKAKVMHREETEHFGAMCCLRTTQKNQWSLEGLYNETFGGNNE